ncbi:PorP/SprF family type IX secretion system membrane protein [uncultured Mucilaginibacter sp.]|uniref:PorP/SprF family type IX secretion system membrane protein n=1 Tax=uncultured Mucilaginibacter sp. TaxID=797541 RepID=UPI002600CF74|nr:PorP/SprF family type IX secretion system membrane protein [uncultured Mucilaginibacter sp.]
MKKLILISVLLLGFCLNNVYAQVDPHFSQYYAYPLWLNPALTGIIDGDARVTANIKNQWAGVGSGYRTAAFSGDMRTSDKVSLGLNVIDQTAGSAGFNYFAAYGSFAYQIPVSRNGYQKLNFGVQAGFINRSFNSSQLQLDNQYTPGVGYDPNAGTDGIAGTNAFVFDSSAGVFYYNGDPSSTVNLFGGVSAAHLVPTNSTLTSDGLNGRMPFRYTVHGGARIKVANNAEITPHAMYVNEQQNRIIATGLNVEFRMQEDYSFIIGGMYQVNAAAIANTGFHLKNMIIGISYDFNNSPLQTAINGQGGYELSLSYVLTHRLANREQICPRF